MGSWLYLSYLDFSYHDEIPKFGQSCFLPLMDVLSLPTDPALDPH